MSPRESPVRSIARAAAALGAALLVACVASGELSPGQPVPRPADWRTWTHVKSMVIQEGHPLFDAFGGIHHVYANEEALAGMREGRGEYADGSILVFDLLEASASEGAIAEGPRKVLGVMHRSAERFSTTGGWGFAAFAGDTGDDVVIDAAQQCFSCHTSQAGRGYVFSTWRP